MINILILLSVCGVLSIAAALTDYIYYSNKNTLIGIEPEEQNKYKNTIEDNGKYFRHQTTNEALKLILRWKPAQKTLIRKSLVNLIACMISVLIILWVTKN